MEFIWVSIVILFAAIGFVLGKNFSKLKNQNTAQLAENEKLSLRSRLEETQKQLQKQEEIHRQMQAEKENLLTDLARKESTLLHLETRQKEQKTELEQLQEKFQKEFENLAQKILDEKTQKFTAQNKENLLNILHPLQEKIKTFEQKVETTHKESIDYHAALRQQIIGLKELNAQITKETTNLTKALKGESKTQGNWGELVLERVLEKSGLEKGREYEVQQSMTNQDGRRLQPDVLVRLPDGKTLIIDAKVSLNAYERYVNQDDETERSQSLKDHLLSIRRHVEQLSQKSYEDLLAGQTPDFVLMFIPVEPAFALAVNTEPMLYNQAFDKNIIIVTPATLLATLRTVESMWTTRKQQKNAFEIAQQAGALYDKFEGFVNDLIKIGKKMDEAKTEYKNAMNKLTEGRGNLITSVEKLKIMGAKAKKNLPEKLLERAGEAEDDH